MSKSGFYRSVDTAAKAIVLIIVGLTFMVIGFGGAIYLAEAAVKTKTPIPRFAYFAGSLGLLGALMLPSVFDVLFPRVQKIYVLFFPNGLPLIGGRRATDPQPPAPPSSGDAKGPG